jgi:hypothetical protein
MELQLMMKIVFLHAIGKGSGKDEALVPLTLNNQLSIDFKIDTGA